MRGVCGFTYDSGQFYQYAGILIFSKLEGGGSFQLGKVIDIVLKWPYLQLSPSYWLILYQYFFNIFRRFLIHRSRRCLLLFIWHFSCSCILRHGDEVS